MLLRSYLAKCYPIRVWTWTTTLWKCLNGLVKQCTLKTWITMLDKIYSSVDKVQYFFSAFRWLVIFTPTFLAAWENTTLKEIWFKTQEVEINSGHSSRVKCWIPDELTYTAFNSYFCNTCLPKWVYWSTVED